MNIPPAAGHIARATHYLTGDDGKGDVKTNRHIITLVARWLERGSENDGEIVKSYKDLHLAIEEYLELPF